MNYKPDYGIWGRPRFRIKWGWYPVVFLAGVLVGVIVAGYWQANAIKKQVPLDDVYLNGSGPVTPAPDFPELIPNDLPLTPLEILTDDQTPPPPKNKVSDEVDRIGADLTRITWYGPPTFTAGKPTASGLTLASASMQATAMKLNGICAVSPDFKEAYDRVKTHDYAVILLESSPKAGMYLCVDRTGEDVRNTVDIWCEYCTEDWRYFTKVRIMNPR